MERYLEDPLSEALLRGDFEKASGVKVTSGETELILTPVAAAPAKKAKAAPKAKAPAKVKAEPKAKKRDEKSTNGQGKKK